MAQIDEADQIPPWNGGNRRCVTIGQFYDDHCICIKGGSTKSGIIRSFSSAGVS